MTEKWYLKSQEELESVLRTSVADGLSPSAAASRLRTDGGNNIYSLKRRTALRVALRECFDLPSILLLFMLVINGLDHEGILSILVILAGIAIRTVFYIRAMRVFSDMAIRAIPRARVVRNRTLCRIDSRRVLQGDVLYLQPGDFIPADARIVKGKVRVSEHRITKKKTPADKENGTVADTSAMELSSLSNMVFAGSRVVDGRAMAIVTDTGDDTLLMEFNGRISISTFERMPVVRRMNKHCALCETILLATVVVAAFLSMLVGDHSIVRAFIFSLATAVSAVSECYFAGAAYIISRAIQSLDGKRATDRTLLRDMRLLDLLSQADYVLIRDSFAREDVTHLSAYVAEMKRLGIRPILLTDRVEYAELFFGKLTCFAPQKEHFLNRAKFLAATDARLWQLADKIGTYSCLDTEESLRLLRVLQMNGATVAVLSSDKQDADLMREADVSATVSLASNTQGREEQSELEMIADICIPARKKPRGGIRALNDIVRVGRCLPAKMNALFSYFLTSATARLVLCLYGIFMPDSGMTPCAILAVGLLFDLAFAAVLAATDSGRNRAVPDTDFRYRTPANFVSPAVAGLLSAGIVLLGWVAEHYLVRSGVSGYFLVLMLVSALFNGIAALRREGLTVTPLGWLPTVAQIVGCLAIIAVFIWLPSVGSLLLVEGLTPLAVLVAIAGGFLQIFCQKILFGTKILIQNY
ncbi:MAG: hypothetical protein J6D21_12860 [Clostridia bacterium]|nr:hypothetical protein [Clostridia bacterium]